MFKKMIDQDTLYLRMTRAYKFIYEEKPEKTSENESDSPPAASEHIDTFQANRNCAAENNKQNDRYDEISREFPK